MLLINKGYAQDDIVINTVTGTSNSLHSFIRNDTSTNLAHVLGYQFKDDGAGGNFMWVKGTVPTTLTDNGVIVIPVTQTGCNIGYWKRVITEDFINVKWFGAISGSQTAGSINDKAFADAIALAYSIGDENRKRIYIPTGIYDFSSKIIINSKIEIYGDGGNVFSTTQFSKLRFNFANLTDEAILVNANVGNVKLHDLVVQGSFGVTGMTVPNTTSTKHGINAYSPITVKNITVLDFEGNGYNLYGDINVVASSNVSHSILENCSAIENGNNGFYIAGGDANGVDFIHCDSRDNIGYGFYDKSFLGNNYTGCMTHHNGVKNNHGGSYIVIDDNSSCVFTGCYVEGDQTIPTLNARSIYIGGTTDYGVAGPYISGSGGAAAAGYNTNVSITPGWQSPYKLKLDNDPNHDRNVTPFCHKESGIGIRVEYVDSLDPTKTTDFPYALTYDHLHESIAFKYANLDGGNIWETPTTGCPEGRYGRSKNELGSMIIRKLLIPELYNDITVTPPKSEWGESKELGFAKDVPASGVYEQGDILFNSNSTKANVLGWKYFRPVANLPGTWKELKLSNSDEISSKVQTTNSTTTPIASLAMQDGDIFNGVATFFGMDLNGNVVTGRLDFKAKKWNGTITLLQSSSSNYFTDMAGSTVPTYNIINNTTDLQLNVTGLNSTTINWVVKVVNQSNL